MTVLASRLVWSGAMASTPLNIISVRRASTVFAVKTVS